MLIRCMAGIPPPQAEVVEAKDTKARGKDRGKEKGGGSDSPEEQDPNVHALQVAAAGLLSQMVELVPDAAEKVTGPITRGSRFEQLRRSSLLEGGRGASDCPEGKSGERRQRFRVWGTPTRMSYLWMR